MVIINGSNTALVAYLTAALGERGHKLRPVPTDAHLFSEVVDQDARAVVGVDLDAADDDVLTGVIGAASAPSAKLVVYVTDRADDVFNLAQVAWKCHCF